MNPNPLMNPRSVTWGALSIAGVKAISMRQRGRILRDSSDADRFESLVAVAAIGTEIILEGDDIAAQLRETALGAEAELRFTIEGATPSDDPVTISFPCAVLAERTVQSRHGDIANGVLRFVARSFDGTTAPMSVS
ncbi:MAG: hypothetical protein WC712_05315 [Candidatus Brocadiia bacterium]